MLTQTPSVSSGTRGRIINIFSSCGINPTKNYFTYGLANSVIAQMTKQIATDFSSEGIVCNGIAPKTIADALPEHGYFPRTGVSNQCKSLDVANTVIFLASEENRCLQGSNILLGDRISML